MKCSILGSMLLRVSREGDTSEEAQRKRFVLYSLSAGFILVLIAATVQFVRPTNTAARVLIMYLFCTTLMPLVYAIMRRDISMTFSNVLCYGYLFAIFFFDLYSKTKRNLRGWVLSIIVIDLRLLIKLPLKNSLLLIVLWLACTAIEDTARAGLYDLLFLPDRDDRLFSCGCENYPCGVNPSVSIAFFVYNLVVLVLHYCFTRQFVNDSNAEKRRMQTSITTAWEVAEFLAAFDLSAAEQALDKHASDLPEELTSSFELILANLKRYKPFLPESLFEFVNAGGMEGFASRNDASLSMTEPPGLFGGDTTIVFTDIKDSTKLWDEDPDNMKHALKIHNNLIRAKLVGSEGYEVKTIGDSFMVAFKTLASGIEFSLSVQTALGVVEWPQGFTSITTRIGLHCGEVSAEHNPVTQRYDYHGPVVNIASRLEGVCPPGSVAMMNDVYLHLLSTNKESLWGSLCSDPRVLKLKGVHEAHHVVFVMPVRNENAISEFSYGSGHDRSSQGSGSFAIQGSLPHKVLGLREGLLHSQSFTMTSTEMCDVTVCKLEAVLSSVVHVVDRNEGMVMGLMSSTLHVSWNTLRKCVSHLETGFRYARMVAEDAKIPHTANIAIACGSAYHGLLSVGSAKYVSVLSPACNLATTLLKIATSLTVRCLHATMPSHPCTASRDPSLCSLVRPLVSLSGSVVYEVNLVVGYDPDDSVVPEPTWGWSPAYLAAYNQNLTEEITVKATSDPVLHYVAKHLGQNLSCFTS